MLRLLPLLLLVACHGSPGPRADAKGTAAAFVKKQTSLALPADLLARCEVADSASAWRAARFAFGIEASALADDWCNFAIERAVLVVVPAACGPALAWSRIEEEGVDVLTLTAAAASPPSAGARLHAMVVAARPASLAVVLRTPSPDGLGREATLGVFVAR